MQAGDSAQAHFAQSGSSAVALRDDAGQSEGCLEGALRDRSGEEESRWQQRTVNPESQAFKETWNSSKGSVPVR